MSQNDNNHAECIFCKIVDGSIPSHKVCEDENFLAILDIHPMSPGHTLIIPKKHYRWVWDVPNAGAYFEYTKKLALAIKKAFKTEFVVSKIIGEEIHHAHIWVYPGEKVTGDRMDFAKNIEKIRQNM